MKILVTGGAGFIGSHVVDRCIADGHSVCILDNLSTGVQENINPKAKFFKLDLQSDHVENLIATEKFDVIFHLAAQIDVRKSVDNPAFDASTNIVGSLNLYQSAQRYGVKKIIFSSTGGAIYGEQDFFPATEEHPCRPISPYGIAKLSNEHYLYYYKEVWGMNYICLRYANVYGPRQNPHGEAGVVAIFAERMLSGKHPMINGEGKQTRDYVFVADVADANLRALKHPASGIFNVGTGVENDVNVIFRELRKHLAPDCPENHGAAKAGEQKRSVISYAKIEKAMGWKPTVQLAEGLKLTAEFFKRKHKK
jgi:UDP-glucose 4-epimerase